MVLPVYVYRMPSAAVMISICFFGEISARLSEQGFRCRVISLQHFTWTGVNVSDSAGDAGTLHARSSILEPALTRHTRVRVPAEAHFL